MVASLTPHGWVRTYLHDPADPSGRVVSRVTYYGDAGRGASYIHRRLDQASYALRPGQVGYAPKNWCMYPG